MFKRGRIDRDGAVRILRAYRRISIELVPFDLDRAVALAADLDVYIYDAFVLDCARASGAPLVSLDRGQRAAAQRAGIDLHPF